MNLRQIHDIVPLLFLMLFITGCGTSAPAYQRTVDGFLEALREHDAEQLKEHILTNNEVNQLIFQALSENFKAMDIAQDMRSSIEERFGETAEKTFYEKTLKTLNEVQNTFNFNDPEINVTGHKASLTMGGTEIPMRLVRDNQGWKIDFSPFIDLNSADAMYSTVHLEYLVLQALNNEFNRIASWTVFLERYEKLKTEKSPGFKQ